MEAGEEHAGRGEEGGALLHQAGGGGAAGAGGASSYHGRPIILRIGLRETRGPAEDREAGGRGGYWRTQGPPGGHGHWAPGGRGHGHQGTRY